MSPGAIAGVVIAAIVVAAIIGLVVSILLSRYAYRYMYVRDLDSNEMSADAPERYNLEGDTAKNENKEQHQKSETEGGKGGLKLVDLERNDEVEAKRVEIRGASV